MSVLAIEKVNLVFVYGTLKEGFGNSCVMRDGKKLFDAVTTEGFDMWDVGSGFPCITPNYGGSGVSGELWAVSNDDMIGLDRLESEGFMYARVEGDVLCEGVTSPVKCWMYVWMKGVEGMEIVGDGVWK